MIRHSICSACMLVSSILYAGEMNSKKLTLATTTWCPYTCVGESQGSNIIGDYVAEVLAQEGIQLVVESFPWSRAIKFAEQGQVDGLLTATHAEAPSLSFTEQPTGFYQVCFFTNRTNAWRYSPPLNLTQQTLGALKDYGYNDVLDRYITQPYQDVVTLAGDNGLSRLISLLSKGRVDVIVADPLVLSWQLRKENLQENAIVNAGCMDKQPFYLALSRHYQNHAVLLQKLNRAFSRAENQQKLEHTLQKYTLK